MKRHLNKAEIAASVAGDELGADAREHLADCLDCRRKVGAMSELIDGRRRQQASDEPDWEAQLQSVMARIPATVEAAPVRTTRWWRPMLMAAAVVMVAVVVGILGTSGPTVVTTNGDIPVDQILAEVDALLDDDSIPGFEIIDPGVDDLESYFDNGTS
jgi:predicted anti-sigma-YlaC factor YlaD